MPTSGLEIADVIFASTLVPLPYRHVCQGMWMVKRSSLHLRFSKGHGHTFWKSHTNINSCFYLNKAEIFVFAY
jgi:hypothetical protein